MALMMKWQVYSITLKSSTFPSFSSNKIFIKRVRGYDNLTSLRFSPVVHNIINKVVGKYPETICEWGCQKRQKVIKTESKWCKLVVKQLVDLQT